MEFITRLFDLMGSDDGFETLFLQQSVDWFFPEKDRDLSIIIKGIIILSSPLCRSWIGPKDISE